MENAGQNIPKKENGNNNKKKWMKYQETNCTTEPK